MQHCESLAVEDWPVERVVPYEGNPRTITDAAVRKVAASIKTYGFRQPVVVDEQGVIIIGHTRLRAAIQLRRKTVPVHVAKGLTPAKVKALRLADNRTHEEATWDSAALAVDLQTLTELGFDLELTGFDPSDLVSAGDVFLPALNPTAAGGVVTAADVEKTAGQLATEFQAKSKQTIVDITCPSCNASISLNRDAL